MTWHSGCETRAALRATAWGLELGTRGIVSHSCADDRALATAAAFRNGLGGWVCGRDCRGWRHDYAAGVVELGPGPAARVGHKQAAGDVWFGQRCVALCAGENGSIERLRARLCIFADGRRAGHARGSAARSFISETSDSRPASGGGDLQIGRAARR